MHTKHMKKDTAKRIHERFGGRRQKTDTKRN